MHHLFHKFSSTQNFLHNFFPKTIFSLAILYTHLLLQKTTVCTHTVLQLLSLTEFSKQIRVFFRSQTIWSTNLIFHTTFNPHSLHTKKHIVCSPIVNPRNFAGRPNPVGLPRQQFPNGGAQTPSPSFLPSSRREPQRVYRGNNFLMDGHMTPVNLLLDAQVNILRRRSKVQIFRQNFTSHVVGFARVL